MKNTSARLNTRREHDSKLRTESLRVCLSRNFKTENKQKMTRKKAVAKPRTMRNSQKVYCAYAMNTGE